MALSLTPAFTLLRASDHCHRLTQFEHFLYAEGVISDFHTLDTL